QIADRGGKAVKEMVYQVRNAGEWVIRLGDDTEESHRRAAAALDDLWMHSGELFEADAGVAPLVEAGVALDPAAIRPAWDATIDRVLAEATLKRPADGWMQSGGRRGRHTQ